MGKEGLGEEHRETRNSIWKKKKGVVVLEKQKKIKNGKNKKIPKIRKLGSRYA